MFLTNSELQCLTGYRQKTRIRLWLANKRFNYVVRADGWPAVLRSEVERMLSASRTAEWTSPARRAQTETQKQGPADPRL